MFVSLVFFLFFILKMHYNSNLTIFSLLLFCVVKISKNKTKQKSFIVFCTS